MSHREFQSCIDACSACAQACEHCSVACLGEREVAKLAECIRLDLDCAELCWSAASHMSRDSQFAAAVCAVCADACDACAAECEKHQQMGHCRECAAACRRCADECRQMAGASA
jgi:hypothetical protein